MSHYADFYEAEDRRRREEEAAFCAKQREKGLVEVPSILQRIHGNPLPQFVTPLRLEELRQEVRAALGILL